MTFWPQIGLICVGSAISLLINMWFFYWRKSVEEPSDALKTMRRDLDVLTAAFISHTGITINGKSYRTED